ncbi:phospholipid-translocating P-type ATPase [Atractiella rhizophila]|nr:phospholipid-translocating P-type ATPase [Atractiella rhizophila]
MPLFKSNHPPQAEPNSSVGDPAAASPPEAAQGTAPPSSSDSSSPTFNSGKHTTPSKQVNKQRSPRVAAGSTKKVSLWERWKNVDVLAYFFSPKPPSKFGRTLFIAQPLPEESMALQHKVLLRKGNKEKGKKAWGLGGKKKAVNQEEGWLFATNQVLTSKYNIFTFVPKNLLEQFRRVANVFFLVLVILQFFPIFQNVSPALAAFPLLTVLAITALKDGYEDIKRHESDRRTNGIECLALRTGEEHEGLHLPHLFSHNEEGREVPFNPNHTENKEKKINVPGASWLMSKILRKKPEVGDLEAGDAEGQRDEKSEVDGGRGERRRTGWWGRRTVKRKARKEQKEKEIKEKGGNKESVIVQNTVAPAQLSGGAAPSQTAQPEPESTTPKHPHWATTTWEDIKVGQLLLLRSDDSVPADCLILATSEEENVCYVETKNLDGETNLKSRSAKRPDAEDVVKKIRAKGGFRIESERPDTNMFKYNGALVLQGGEFDKYPITINEMLLRGCVVRNTDWVLCVAVFTGRDSKIVLNSGGTPSKRSRIEKQMNPQVFLNLALLGVMCVLCGVGDHFLEVYYYHRNSYWTVNENRSDDNPNFNGLITFLNGMITFQNVVPISLYISIEFVRTTQAFYIYMDNDIWYRTTPEGKLIEGDHQADKGGVDRRTTAKSWNLSDDLGQVEYIFSDKTGTLTQNSMVFRRCEVGGKVYSGTERKREGEGEDGEKTSGDGATRIASLEEATSESDASIGLPKPEGLPKTTADLPNNFFDASLNRDLSEDPDSAQARKLHGFFTNLALCHTVLAAEDEDGTLHYKAQSPDESALVQAAADVGFIFLGRDKNVLRLATPGSEDISEWELLNVLEFTSARKRMSIVVRRLGVREDRSSTVEGDLNRMVEGTGRLFLLTKGADNVIFERLAPGQDSVKADADSALEDFANEGLRTLCLAFKELNEDDYQDWNMRYNDATTLIEGRDEKMEELASEFESNLQFLGSTAIEDKLQDGVPETIADLRRAGIKIWVATGDKLETAIAIGKTCNLISKDMNLIIIRGSEFDAGPRSAYSQIAMALEKFFDAGDVIANQLNQPPNHDHLGETPRQSMQRSRPSVGLRRSGDHSRPGVKRAPTGLSDIVGDNNGQKGGGYGLVIDGGSLTHAFAEPFTKDLLLELSTRCNTVVCCRTSPLQKALIVKLVKDGLGALCLAIGDGANDVSMIQASIGVAGEEGLQAVNSSDYAIAQFRYLKRLLLVHGHLSYFRNSSMIVNFFEKEIIGIGILFWFQFYCLLSTTTVYEYTFLLFYNVFWTLVPVLAIGIFDFDLRPRTLMAVPEVYRFGRQGHLQSLVVYFTILYTYDTTTARGDGYDVYLYEFSTVMIISAVFTCNFFNGFNTRAWNWWVLCGVLIGPVLIVSYGAVYQAISPGWIWTPVYGNNKFIFTACNAYFSFLVPIFICLVPRYAWRYYKELYHPTDIDILRYVEHVDPKHDFENDPMMPGVREKQRFTDDASQEDLEPLRAPSRPVMHDSVELGRVVSARSQTHDMSSPTLGAARLTGYAFSQDDSVGARALGGPIRRYTSSQQLFLAVASAN